MPGQRTVFSGKSGSSIRGHPAGGRVGVGVRRRKSRESNSRRTARRLSGWRWAAGAGRPRRSGQWEQPRAARVVGGPEARAAAAGGDRVRVVHGEAGAHQRVDVVDLGALQEVDRLAVDVDLHAVRLEDLVLGRRGVLEHHPVAEAGAAAGVDVDAQPDRRVRLLGRQLAQLRRGGVGQVDDGRLDSSSIGLGPPQALFDAIVTDGSRASSGPIVRTATSFDKRRAETPERGRADRSRPVAQSAGPGRSRASSARSSRRRW